MKCLWKNILCLLCSCCVCSFAQAEDLDPETSAYLSDMKYAKNIEVKTYLVTKDQVAKIFSDDTAEVAQKTNKELYGKEIFLLIRCKNAGKYHALGSLNCKTLLNGTTSSNEGTPITVEIMLMSGYMKSFSDTVIPLNSGIIPNNDNKPIVNLEWKNVYTI